VKLAFVLWIASAAWAQEMGQVPPASEAPSSQSGGARVQSLTPPDAEREPARMRGSIPASVIYVSGRVLLEEETPPAGAVLIQGICNGNLVREAYNASRGRFTLQFSGMQRPGTNVRFDRPSLEGCELRLSSPGFGAHVLDLSTRRVMDNPDTGTVVLRRVARSDGVLVSLTSLSAPKAARKAYEKGLHAAHAGKWESARARFEKAVALYPQYAEAWYELGLLEQREGRAEPARKCYRQAVTADGRFLKPYAKLADLALRERRWPEVAEVTASMMKLDPAGSLTASFYNALANFNLRRFDAAEQSARRAITLDTRHGLPKAEHLLGVILANKNDYAGAASHMRAYLTLAPQAPDAGFVRKQIAQLEKSLPRQP